MIQFRSFKENNKKNVSLKERQKRATAHNRLDMLNVLRYLLLSVHKPLRVRSNTKYTEREKKELIRKLTLAVLIMVTISRF